MTAPARMSGPDAARLQRAALLATRRYPGAVGAFLAAELRLWLEFGYRIGGHSMVMAIVDELLKSESEAA